jgi:hypothetical protein
MRRKTEFQQEIRDLQQPPRRKPEAGLALNVSGPMDKSSLSPAQRLARKKRLDAAPTADAQPVAETENLHEELAAALVRNSKSG